VPARLRHVLQPHAHEAADKVDAAMEASAEGMRALWISLAVLAGTAVLQAVVVAISGSVALLGDTLHNAADALTAVPLGIAFVVGRRPPTRRGRCHIGPQPAMKTRPAPRHRSTKP
jgi:Co/Zn/Cd efflux system component